jgi:short chain dehydrogenase
MPPELAAARDEEKHEDFRTLQRQNGWRKTKGFMMARVFVTGSADGLGKMAADLLIEHGRQVVLHVRSAARADETRKKVAGAEDIVVGDLSSIAETKSVADQVNKLGRVDAIIPQRRDRLPRAEAGEDCGRPAPTLRREHSRSVHSNRPHHDAEATGVPVLRNALRGRIASRRHVVGEAAVERLPSLRRDQGCIVDRSQDIGWQSIRKDIAPFAVTWTYIP